MADPPVPAAQDVLEVRLKALEDGEIDDDEDFYIYAVRAREKGASEDIDLMFDYSYIDDKNGYGDQGELRISETHVIFACHIDVVATSRSLVRISIAEPLPFVDEVPRLVALIVNVVELPGSARQIVAKMRLGLEGEPGRVLRPSRSLDFREG